jgi:hypothetical protein
MARTGSAKPVQTFAWKTHRMDFDPNPPTGERKRSGPRWYSRVAFFVLALLLLFNAIAMFVNAEANDEQACYTRVNAAAMSGFSDADDMFWKCDQRFERGRYAPPPD